MDFRLVRGGQDVVISPPADYVFRAEDVLIVAGENKTIEKLERQA